MRAGFITALLLILPAAGAAAEPEQVNLVCSGITNRVGSAGGVGMIGGKAIVMETNTRTNSPDVVRFEATPLAGRIRLPHSLISVLHKSADDDWFPLSSVKMSSRQIDAQFVLNVVRKPSVRIDRDTGDIEIHSSGLDFHGSCEIAPVGQPKF